MLSWPAVRRRRLARQHLTRPSAAGVVAVAGAIGTAHAQMQPAAELSLALRAQGATRADTQRALWDERTLVRTYGLRGTTHLVPAAELDIWLTALRSLPRPRQRGEVAGQLDRAKLRRLVAAIVDALEQTGPDGLDRTALGERVLRRLGPWAAVRSVPAFGDWWPLWTVGIEAAAAQGRLVLGRAERGRTAYLPRPDRVAPVDRDAAVAEVARRFLHVYGPASQQDLVRWFRTTPVGAKAALQAAGAVPTKVAGVTAWVLAGEDGPVADDDVDPDVHLLPHFDAYLVGSRPREQLVPPEHAARLLRGGASGPVPALVVDGVAAGVWTHAAAGGRERVTVEPLRRLSKANRGGLEQAAGRIGYALGREVELTVGPVDVRPHL